MRFRDGMVRDGNLVVGDLKGDGTRCPDNDEDRKGTVRRSREPVARGEVTTGDTVTWGEMDGEGHHRD